MATLNTHPGHISTLKRRHGLDRCRYRGWAGFQRWVGLGIMADNLIQIGRCLLRAPLEGEKTVSARRIEWFEIGTMGLV